MSDQVNHEIALVAFRAVAAVARPAHPAFQTHATSSVSLTKGADTNEIEITNVTVTYASAEGKKHEALLTADNPKTAAELRSFADATRALSVADGTPPRSIRLFIAQSAPPPANPVSVTMPLAGDDPDVAHAQLPAGLHRTHWKG